jgi:hypothetical protein
MPAEQRRPDSNSDETSCFLSVEEGVLRHESVGRPQTLARDSKIEYGMRGDLDHIKQDILDG